MIRGRSFEHRLVQRAVSIVSELAPIPPAASTDIIAGYMLGLV